MDFLNLVFGQDKRQQRQMTRTLDFTRQLTLATGAVPRLAARLDLAHLGDIALEGVYVLIVKAFALWAIGAAATVATATPTSIRSFPAATIIIVVVKAAFAVTIAVAFTVTHGMDFL
jgi:hypothetical protein